MKDFKFLCTLLLTALAFSACSNDEIVEPESNQPVTDGITFTAVFSVKNGTTRALNDPGDGTLTASWAVDEEIAIIFGGNKYTATVTDVDDGGNATVTATLPLDTPNNQAVTFIYPASAADGSGLRSDLLSSQDGTLATLSSNLDVASAEGNIVVYGGTAQPNGTVTLVNQFAICKFQFTDESDQAIEDITRLFITDLSTTEKITVTTPSAQSAVYVAMLPSNNSTKFEMETGSGKIYQKIASAHLEAGMFYHPSLQAIKSIGEFVDLGLPSGTLWATYNVGASSPEEYGDYFAWGETTTKNLYSFETYQYCNGSPSALTKYCADSSYGYNGFTDNLTELLPEDDAATANWGSDWQMPSYDQIMELLHSCQSVNWTTLNGVNGFQIIGTNLNRIFLPAAGCRVDVNLYSPESEGYYWSRSIDTNTSPMAFSLKFSGMGCDSRSSSRYQGHPIRPVRKR